MTDWVSWFVVAGIAITLEVFSGTFYLLMISIGMIAGGLAAFLGAATSIQLIVASIAGASATYALRRSKIGKSQKQDAARDPNINLDIGQTIFINEWKTGDGRACTARAMYRGALWNIELAKGAIARQGTYIIREIRGSNLIVTNALSHEN